MIPVAKTFLGKEEVNTAREVILSGWVTQGPKVKEFEDAFANYVGSKYACAASSCTTALHLALVAIGVKPGNIVVTVSHSFIATANAVRHCMAEPAFVDIVPDTYNMSPEALNNFLEKECEERQNKLYYKKVKEITNGESPLTVLDNQSREFGRISAVLVVHQIGMPCDLKKILEISEKYNLSVVEDAACAIGSECSLDNGRTFEKIGKPHGDVACFSFHPRKILSTGEGGMITTNNPEYDKIFRLLRHHSMSISDVARHTANKVVIENYLATGYNYKMTDIQAAIGIEQLKKIPEILNKRRALDKLYRKYLREVEWLELPQQPLYAKSNWQSYALRVSKNAPISRDELMQYLLDEGVCTKPGIMNAHKEKPYSNSSFHLPESERARKEVILVSFYSQLKENEIEKIGKLIKKI